VTIVQLEAGQLPRRLKTLGWDRPLRVIGELGAGPAVAIVGSRAASMTGMKRAHALARHLGERGVHVVSGGALGIDGAAHRGALAGNGGTTVVLGTGLGVLYPERHAQLFHDIVRRGGALVSMFPDDLAARPNTFVQRNPLIAALADVVVIVEADVRSGSLSTARAATRQQRIVCAWPGSRGCDALLANGAAICESAADVDAALVGTPRMPAPRDPDEMAVRAAIAAGARGVDAIMRQTNLPLRAVVRALARLQ
jgi:DNA processing protein